MNNETTFNLTRTVMFGEVKQINCLNSLKLIFSWTFSRKLADFSHVVPRSFRSEDFLTAFVWKKQEKKKKEKGNKGGESAKATRVCSGCKVKSYVPQAEIFIYCRLFGGQSYTLAICFSNTFNRYHPGKALRISEKCESGVKFAYVYPQIGLFRDPRQTLPKNSRNPLDDF